MDASGVPSEGFPAVSLVNDDEDWDAPDTLWDEEIAGKLFGDLNRDLLGPLGDDNVIVISDSDEGEQEEDHADIDVVPSSLRVPPVPFTSTTDNDGTPDRVQDNCSGGRSNDEAGTP
jgi:hypothetical protein